MIEILPRFLSDDHIKRIISVAGGSHHDDDGHVSAKKPHHMPWLSDMIERMVLHLPITGLIGADPNVQVYRLSLGGQSSVPLHTDEDFRSQDGMVARYSVLLKLNSSYQGGETRFFGTDTLSIPIGGGVVFNHNIPHEGFPVTSGEKLVLKTGLFVHPMAG